MDKIFSFSVFNSLVETLSFTETAKRLYISQPTVSRTIKKLEENLKVVLFHRTTKSISLSQEGAKLYQRVKPLLVSLSEVEDHFLSAQDHIRGTIRFSAPIFLLGTFYPLLGSFLKEYPDVNIDIDISNEYVDLEKNGINLALRISPDSTIESQRCPKRAKVLSVASRKLLTVASPEYLKIYGTPKHPFELEKHNCLTYTPHHLPEIWRYIEKGEIIQILGSGSIQSSSMLPIIDIALEGVGIANLPNYYVERYFESGQLVPILSAFNPPPTLISLVITDAEYTPFAVKALVEYLALRLPNVLGPTIR